MLDDHTEVVVNDIKDGIRNVVEMIDNGIPIAIDRIKLGLMQNRNELDLANLQLQDMMFC